MTAPLGTGFRPLGRWWQEPPYRMCPAHAQGLWISTPNASLNSPQRHVEYRWAGVLNRFRSATVPYLRWPFAATTYSDHGGICTPRL